MKTDRELLELAAKAAGMDGAKYQEPEQWFETRYGLTQAMYHESTGYWSPLEDDGDALRLLVRIKGELGVWAGSSTHGPCTTLDHEEFSMVEPHGDDPAAATRKIIVRAAAELGKALP